MLENFYLTDNANLLKKQLCGHELTSEEVSRAPLMDRVSTDELIPARKCFEFGVGLADSLLTGLRGGLIGHGDIARLSPRRLIAGESFGYGSSREHAVIALAGANIRVVTAKSFERIFARNAVLNNIVLSDGSGESPQGTDAGLLEAVSTSGGLFNLLDACSTGQEPGTPLSAAQRTVVAKIEDSHRVKELRTETGMQKPSVYDVDVAFSHEYVTAMASDTYANNRPAEVGSLVPTTLFFEDHLSLLERAPGSSRQALAAVARLTEKQRQIAKAWGHPLIASDGPGGGSICHNYLLEKVVLPGQLVVGTDSHTCTAGAIGALALGIGATEIAAAWATGRFLLSGFKTAMIRLVGSKNDAISAKDVALFILRDAAIREALDGQTIIVFSDESEGGVSMDSRSTLCNMAVEYGAATALFEPDAVSFEHLKAREHEITWEDVAVWHSDAGAKFDSCHVLDLSRVDEYFSRPGDPHNVVRASEIMEVRISHAYGGSCTGGKAEDMDDYAEAVRVGMSMGLRVAAGVEAYIQAGSSAVQMYARERGYPELFASAGFEFLPPSCGACINAGPGASRSDGDVTVSSQNRNFPGRSGPGDVYLASPKNVVASAFLGRIGTITDLMASERP